MPVRFSFEPFDRARIIPGSVTAPRGFSAASWRCGIKPSGREDLALLVSDRPCSAAGVFTTNRVRAACVDINRERLGERRGAGADLQQRQRQLLHGRAGMAGRS